MSVGTAHRCSRGTRLLEGVDTPIVRRSVLVGVSHPTGFMMERILPGNPRQSHKITNMRKPITVRRTWSRGLALLVSFLLVFLRAPAAQQTSRYTLVTSSGTIGTLTVTESGRAVDTDSPR